MAEAAIPDDHPDNHDNHDNHDDPTATSRVSNIEKHRDRDFITIRLGPDYGNMAFVGTYHYKINPVTGTVLYDIKYTIKSKQLAYRFDFSVTNPVADSHLAVEMGRYEEHQVSGGVREMYGGG